MAEKVIIKEVAARDGLQAQPKHLSVEQRIALLAALAETGVPELEIGSFVSPKAVPQMAGTDEIAANLPPAQLAYSALVPNMKGYELAVMAGIRSHAIALAATEEMNQNNIRKSLEDTFVDKESMKQYQLLATGLHKQRLALLTKSGGRVLSISAAQLLEDQIKSEVNAWTR